MLKKKREKTWKSYVDMIGDTKENDCVERGVHVNSEEKHDVHQWEMIKWCKIVQK